MRVEPLVVHGHARIAAIAKTAGQGKCRAVAVPELIAGRSEVDLAGCFGSAKAVGDGREYSQQDGRAAQVGVEADCWAALEHEGGLTVPLCTGQLGLCMHRSCSYGAAHGVVTCRAAV